MAGRSKIKSINAQQAFVAHRPVLLGLPTSAPGNQTLAGGQATVTGTLAVTTGLTSITSAVASLGAAAALTGEVVTSTYAAGVLTLAVWMPTSSSVDTPIASTTAVVIDWIALGS